MIMRLCICELCPVVYDPVVCMPSFHSFTGRHFVAKSCTDCYCKEPDHSGYLSARDGVLNVGTDVECMPERRRAMQCVRVYIPT